MIIYMARNRTNGKVYIGQTSVSLSGRRGDHRNKALKYGSRAALHTAIREFGFNCFEWKILEHLSPKEDANQHERDWIEKYRSTDSQYGYNNTNGGNNSFEFTEDVKKKIGEAGKGRKPTEAQRRAASIRMRGSGNPFFGKHHTEEAKEKNGAAHRGKKLTPEHIAKCIHRGEDNGLAILTMEQVKQIKRMYRDGFRRSEIVRITGASLYCVKSIRSEKSWRHVKI